LASETLRPNASGFQTQLLPSASPNWECVNEAVANSDTDYVENSETDVSGTYEADLYDIPDTGIGDADTINSVTIYHTSKKVQVGTAIVTNGRTILRTHDTNTTGLAIALTTSYVERNEVYVNNPFTGVAWTKAEVNALQIGVSLQFQYVGDTRYSYGRCTQVYVVIDYTVGAVTKKVIMDGFVFADWS